MHQTEPPEDLKARKLVELRKDIECLVDASEAEMRHWWHGRITGRLFELEASGILSAREHSAMLDEVRRTEGQRGRLRQSSAAG